MLSNYLKIALRNLFRHKLYTVINVIGLSLGIAVSILIILFIRNESSFDTFHKNADRIYRVLTTRERTDGREVTAFQPMPVRDALKAEFPEIHHAARFTDADVVVSAGDRVFREEAYFTDPDVFLMFDIPFLEGNPETALDNPNQIVVSKGIAAKYFGETPPVGKTLQVRTRSGKEEYMVSGVTAAMPANSFLQFDFIMNIRKHSMYERARERWTSANNSTFLLLRHGASQRQFEDRLPAFVDKYYGETVRRWQAAGNLREGTDAWTMSLQPLGDVHLDTGVDTSPQERGNPVYSYILAGIALLVLTIACINFVTLAIGKSSERAKEVGMRKVLGAVRPQLVRQFWGEALILCLLSLGCGLVLAEGLLPAFSEMSGTRLSIDVVSDGGLLLGLMGILVLVGIAAGSYPALYLSRFQPVETLKGKFKMGGKNLFTRVLIVFQFGLSIFLVSGALILGDQVQFLITKNLGFRPEQVVVLPTRAGSAEKAQAIADRFRVVTSGNPGILNVSVTSGAFTHGHDLWGFQVNGENKETFTYRVDEHYLETLRIPLVEGRNFRKGSTEDREHGLIVNGGWLRMMGWPEPAVGRRIVGSDSEIMENMEVIGVVPDFHFLSLQSEIRPMMMVFGDQSWLDHLLIRISQNNVPVTMQYIRSVWKDVNPEAPFEATFLDGDFRKEYENEMRWSRIVSSASVFAVALACLGLFGLVMLTVTSRTKEIGIRKVLGASGGGIVRLVSKEFLGLVLFGNLLAWPAAYLAASTYLENYAYRIEISILTFVIAGLAALVVAFLAMTGQILKAVKANPVEALRYE